MHVRHVRQRVGGFLQRISSVSVRSAKNFTLTSVATDALGKSKVSGPLEVKFWAPNRETPQLQGS